MIGAKEAYLKAKNITDNNYLVESYDYGKFYGFVFAERKSSEGEQFGGGFYCVDKETGEIRGFNPISDLELLDKAIPITIEE